MPVDLNVIVDDVDQMLRRTLGETIELRTRLAPRLPAIMADAGSIEQILVNLAVNARDAMPDGGTLTTETSLVHLDEEAVRRFPGLRPGDHVRLSMSDTGTGMTPEVLERATDPFFSTKPKGQGTGIGLATVYGIVQRAGGALTFRSTPGAGTTVTVKFPVVEAASAAASPSPGVAPQAGRRVLLVEDEDAVRRIVERILRRNGFDVTGVPGAQAAMEAIERSSAEYDVLLTDVVLPADVRAGSGRGGPPPRAGDGGGLHVGLHRSPERARQGAARRARPEAVHRSRAHRRSGRSALVGGVTRATWVQDRVASVRSADGRRRDDA